MAAAAHAIVPPTAPRSAKTLLDAQSNISHQALHSLLQTLCAEDCGDADWAAIRTTMILSSCAYMAQELLTGPRQAPYHGRFMVAEHHAVWDSLVTQYARVCVQSPRDHGKTYFFDFAYPLWMAMRKPGGSGYIFSGSASQAERILNDIKQEIENNPKLQWLMPREANRKWSSSHIRLANGHHIYARGYLSKVRGGHPDWIVVDDGINDEAAYSETVRKKQIEYFYTAISNMIIPGGQIVVVGTPFHCSDLYADLEKNPSYAFCRFKALNDDGQALWPERYSVADLKKKLDEIGSIRFAREFQCQPISDEMSLFPKRLFRGQQVEQMAVRLGMSREYWEDKGVTPYMAVDFAISSNVGADYTVIWTMGVDPFGNRWIIDIFREQGLPYQEQLSHINRLGRLYEPAVVMVESNQMQRIFGDEMIRTTDLPIKKHNTGVEKHALDKGVPALRVLLENGKFRIPRGDRDSVLRTDVWIDEMHNFTYIKNKLQSVGGHDDTVMACWLCNLAIQRGGFTFTFGENVPDDASDDEDDKATDAFGNPLPPDAKTA